MRAALETALCAAAATALLCTGSIARPIFAIRKPPAAVTNPTTVSWGAPTHNTDGTPIGAEVTGYIIGVSIASVAPSWPGGYQAIVPTLSTATSINVSRLGLGPGMYWIQVATIASSRMSAWTQAAPVIITTRGTLGAVAIDRSGFYVLPDLYVRQLAGTATDQETASATYLQGFLEGAASDGTAMSGNLTP
jgi:hypothetical protein